MELESLKIPTMFPFPNNNRYPLLIYRSAADPGQVQPEWFEKTFAANKWGRSWRNGVYSFHHYHSNAHEVLGCYSGTAELCFGGPDGTVTAMTAGDAVVIPAGVAHCLVHSSPTFHVVGAYPAGSSPDILEGRELEYEEALEFSAAVAVPETDPISGTEGQLIELWH